MASFYVGQRVRIKWSFRHPHHVGAVGRISEGPCDYYDLDNSVYEGYTLDVYEDFGFEADQLEPIINPDNEIGDWSELGFHPSQFDRVKV